MVRGVMGMFGGTCIDYFNMKLVIDCYPMFQHALRYVAVVAPSTRNDTTKSSKEVLLEVIKRRIADGSIIISDCWKAYDCLSDEGYVHQKVNHSKHFKDPETGAHTNSIEGTWQKIKHGVCFPRFGVKSDHLESRLAEYQWRAFVGDEEERFFKFVELVGNVYNGNCEKDSCSYCTLTE
jgi:transposase-like protein